MDSTGGVVITLHEMTIALVAFKALFFILLTVVVWLRSSTRARREYGLGLRKRPDRTVEEVSIIAMMFTLAGVSMADFDLIQETDAASWWRFSVRAAAFLAEWWVLGTLVVDWKRDHDERHNPRTKARPS